jgi:membrane protease YdiL (CAAX protease family)
MVSDKRWDSLAVAQLAMGVILSILLGGLATLGLDYILPKQSTGARSFFAFLIGTIAFHGVTFILITNFLKTHGTTWKEFLGLDLFPWQHALRTACIVGVLAIPFTILLNLVSAALINAIQHQEPDKQLPIILLQQMSGPLQRILFAFSAIVLAPIAEESLFRGILYRYIKQRGYPMFALLGTSLFFAAIHNNLMTFVPLTFLAMILVLLYERTQMLLTPILLHAAFNAVNFSLFFVVKQ